MLWLILALIASEVAMLLIGPRVLPVLRKLKFGQTIYELGPKSHRTKQGTPTMGGLMFAAVTCVVTLLIMSFDTWYGGWDFALALVLVSLLSMLIGLIWWQKIIGQVLVSVAFSLYCYFSPLVGSSILVPFFNVEWDLGVLYVPLMTLVMIFMINSANLQDGLDGLLSSVTVIRWGHGGHGHAAAHAALHDPDLLYADRLVHERDHPARVFQGDPRQAHLQDVAHPPSL